MDNGKVIEVGTGKRRKGRGVGEVTVVVESGRRNEETEKEK